MRKSKYKKRKFGWIYSFYFLKEKLLSFNDITRKKYKYKISKKGFVISYSILCKTIFLKVVTALKTITHVFLQNNIRQKDTTDVVQNCFFSQLMCLVTIISLIYNHNVILPLIEKVGH